VFEQVGGFDRAPDRPCKALGDHPWQQSAVIDMRVTENDSIDLFGIESKRLMIEFLQGARALKQPAIQKNPAAGAEFEARAGYCPGGTVDGQGERHGLWQVRMPIMSKD
jgi:hypothetical protein